MATLVSVLIVLGIGIYLFVAACYLAFCSEMYRFFKYAIHHYPWQENSTGKEKFIFYQNRFRLKGILFFLWPVSMLIKPMSGKNVFTRALSR